MTDIKRNELEAVLEMFQKRSNDYYELARTVKPRSHDRQRFNGEARAYEEAAGIIRHTLRGTSWVAIREKLKKEAV